MNTYTKLNDIALFVEVARRNSFTAAASALNVPTTTLSRRIGELESQLGIKLLTRSTRRMALTEAGTAYYERCKVFVDEAKVAHEELLQLTQIPKGKIRVSITNTLAQMFSPIVMREFARAYPDIECEFDLSSEAIDSLSKPFDIALRLGEQPDSDLIIRKIKDVHCQLFASREYIDEKGMPETPQDLVHHECLRQIGERHSSIWHMKKGDQTVQVDITGKMSATHAGVLARLAVQGLGIVRIPIFSAMEAEIERAGLVHVLPDWEMEPLPLVALLPSRHMPAKAKAFLQFIEPLLAQPSTHAQST